MHPLVVFIVVILIMPQVRCSRISFLKETTEIDTLTKTIETILVFYYNDAQFPTQISSLSSHSDMMYTQNDVIKNILKRNSKMLNFAFRLTNKKHHRLSFYNLAFIDDYRNFIKLLNDLDGVSFDSAGLYAIIITQAGADDKHLIAQVFKDLWNIGVVNAIILTSDISRYSEVIKIYTYFPYDTNHCGEVNPVLLHTVKEGFLDISKINLFPNRMRNLYNCTLRVGTFENRPFIIFESTEDKRNPIVTGLEANLVEILSKRLNFHPKYISAPNNTQWGSVGSHGGTGLLGMIQRKKVDFGIACIAFTNDRSTFLTPGMVHYTTKIVFAIPDGRLYTSLEKLLRPFNRSMWFAVMLCFVLVACVIILIQLSGAHFIITKSNLMMNAVSTVFGNPMADISERDSIRVLVFTWIYYCFIIRTAYQILLFQYLRQEQRWPRVNTIDDIDNEGLSYYMVEVAARFFEDTPHILDRTVYLPHERDNLIKALERLARSEIHGVILVLLDNIGYHNKYKSDMGIIYAMDLSVNVHPMGIHYPKNSPLAKEFDRVINELHSTGIIDHWARSFGSYVFLELSTADQNDLIPLSVSHLRGCFILLLWLNAISFAVFVCEIVSGCKIHKK